MPKLRRVVIQVKQPIDACVYYRVILPYRHLLRDLRRLGVELHLSYALEATDRPDAVYLQRHCPYELIMHALDLQSQGAKIAFDLDDDVFNVPAWSPVRFTEEVRKSITVLRHATDFSWVSTPALQEALYRSSARSPLPFVMPNLIDLEDWKIGRLGVAHPDNVDTVRILWAGSSTHEKDLEMIEPVLTTILKDYPQVRFVVGGECPARWRANWFRHIDELPWAPISEYPKMLMNARAHIGLCPLVDIPFNASKSAIKFLEYTMAGMATVASAVPAYTAIKADDAIRYATTQIDWYNQITELIIDHEKRMDLYVKARAMVENYWSWQKSPFKQNWLVGFAQLAGLEINKKGEDTPLPSPQRGGLATESSANENGQPIDEARLLPPV